MSVTRLTDSANIYVEYHDVLQAEINVTATGAVANLLPIVGSATGTYNSPDIVNTIHKGGMFSLNFVSIAATTTVRVTFQRKDPLSGTYINVLSASFDAIATASGGTGVLFNWLWYPFINSTSVITANTSVIPEPFSRTIRAIASITATASQGVGTGSNIQLSLSKIP